MHRGNTDLLRRIALLKTAIRHKYRAFKHGTVQTTEQLEKQYKPIIEELKKTGTPHKVIKEEEPSKIHESFVPAIASTPHRPPPSFVSNGEVFGDDPEPEAAIEKLLSTPDGQQEASTFIEENFANKLTRKYMLKLLKDLGGSKRAIDNQFGPRYEGATLMVGSEPLKFDDQGAIVIANTTYAPTVGLYEVLFKRLPDDQLYTQSDLDAYKDILIKTNAHKKNYNYKSHINRDTSLKYREVISKLFPKNLYGGSGWKTYGSRDIMYWNDPNEIVDRLRLLVASSQAGNKGHVNEIINIISELKEGRYIKGAGNTIYHQLINVDR